MKSLKLKYVVLIILLIVFADQALKIWIKLNFEENKDTNLTSVSWFRLHYIENPGMAWGWKFGNETGKVVLTLFRLAAVIFGTWYLGKIVKQKYNRGFIVCAALIYAGALGNLIDSMFYGMIFDKGLIYSAAISDYIHPDGIARFSSNGYSSFLHGCVVDMLHFPLFEIGNFKFFNAIFNIADASISVGVITLLVFQKRFLKKHKPDDNHPVVETNTNVTDKVQVL